MGFLGVFPQDWSVSFFLTFYILEHLCTCAHMPFGQVQSMQKSPLISFTLEMHSDFLRVPISNKHKGRNITTCMHLHVLLLSFFFCILLISLLKPLKLLTSNQWSVSTPKIHHKATKGCSAAHILPHACSQALAKNFCTLLPTESSEAPVMVNN